MASDKDKMLDSAKYYAKLVSSAKSACEKAARALVLPQSEVSENWRGASGDAMAQALTNVRENLLCISSQLSSLESQMQTHTQDIYNNWPEEDKVNI